MATKYKKRKIALITLMVVILSLIIIRLLLPSIVKNQVNKRLAEIDGYQGSISEVDLHLYRGAAKIFDFNIDKYNEKQLEPFINVPASEFSIEWKSLFKGAIVGEMTLFSPALNIDITSSGEAEQTGMEIDWVDLVKDLTPIRINTFRIENAQLDVDFPASEKPDFDFDMKEIDVLITNISNVEDKSHALPSDIKITSKISNYYGNLDVTAKANMLKEIPDMDMNMTLEGLRLESLNAFLTYYAGMDFESGTMNLYSEVALKDKAFEGYIKPTLHDPVIFEAKEEDRSLWQAAKELVTEGVQEIFENQKIEQTAAKIPISGTIEGASVNYWQAFVTNLRNAYIEALKNQLDNTIAFGEVAEK
ncbi:DUF748 domain-containing protein [Portibacter lacus]|uniref:DUF748 domain-containing protein n=1 Tax=Portibacter lacus TaxID=1099794 RepID=A0AA37SRY5_9BACT|nr:DUF748 domain-containing protein [Portibacter lacus]GLR18474.1 hypothetical protein GCM10007940_30900 [Portibacter lacus]